MKLGFCIVIVYIYVLCCNVMQSILKFLCPHTDDNYKDFVFSLSVRLPIGMAGSRNYTVVVAATVGGWGDGGGGGELSSVGAATNSIFVATTFCRDNHMFVFVATKIVFVATNIVIVATKVCLSR